MVWAAKFAKFQYKLQHLWWLPKSMSKLVEDWLTSFFAVQYTKFLDQVNRSTRNLIPTGINEWNVVEFLIFLAISPTSYAILRRNSDPTKPRINFTFSSQSVWLSPSTSVFRFWTFCPHQFFWQRRFLKIFKTSFLLIHFTCLKATAQLQRDTTPLQRDSSLLKFSEWLPLYSTNEIIF